MDPDRALAAVFSEIVNGAEAPGEAVLLNSGDVGLLRSLGKLSAAEASRAADPAGGSATIAAHAQHVRFGLELMNRWAREGGDPFADARWDEAWKLSAVDEAAWSEILGGLEREARLWGETLASRPAATARERLWMAGSVAHVAYHLGAIRQIHRALRGPKEGTLANRS